jgi:polar amino acid transport system substrate-binding protein
MTRLRNPLLLSTILLLANIFAVAAQNESNDLKASVAEIPGLADSTGKGPLIDLVKAIDEAYTEGSINIKTYPFNRSVNNVVTGEADFHLPYMENPEVDQSKLPFYNECEPLGKVYFVLYTNTDKIITKKNVYDIVSSKSKMPYTIEAPGGDQYPFTIIQTNDIVTSLKKLALGRLDGVLWAVDEADVVLKSLKLKNIHRELIIEGNSSLIVRKGSGSDKVIKKLNDAIIVLRKNGKLESIHSKLHLPYTEWQPSQMNW